jgi:hypothetical protein
MGLVPAKLKRETSWAFKIAAARFPFQYRAASNYAVTKQRPSARRRS